MKKYVKPELVYERYELTEQIADCDFELIDTTLRDPSSCAFKGDEDSSLYNYVILLDTTTSCDFGMEQYCYYAGANGMNTFNS